MIRVFDIDFFWDRYIVINMIGKFYKMLVLNMVVEYVLSEYDLIFLFDFYIDVFIDIMDVVWKVSFFFR